MLQQLNWMRINEIENKITGVLLRSGVYGEFVCHFVKLFALSTNLSVRKRIWLLKTEIEFLKMKLSERKWNRMPENEITCIFFEIDTGMLTSNQFRCEIERPITNLNDISTKLAGKTYINIFNIRNMWRWPIRSIGHLLFFIFFKNFILQVVSHYISQYNHS